MNDRETASAAELAIDRMASLDPDPEGSEEGVAGLSTDWSVPWSDLMMVLFVLFLVLFAYEKSTQAEARATAAAEPESRRQVESPSRGLYEASRELVRSARLDDIQVVYLSDRSIKVSVRGATYFDLGRSELQPETEEFLDGLARLLRGSSSEIRVVGHTDSVSAAGSGYPTNWELSAARASQVARYLIDREQLDPGRFEVVGRSMYQPAVPNNTEANQSRNRRVEIFILPSPFDAPAEG